MCDPVTMTMISMAATGIGTAMQMKSQADARDEQQAIIRRNDENQSKLTQKNADALVGAREGFARENFDSALSNETAQLTQKYQDVQSDGQIPGQFSYGKRETPQVVKDFEMKERGKAKDFTNDYAAKLAAMSGFGETMFDKNIGTARAGEVMDMNRSFMQGSNLVAENQLASSQANAGSPLGDLLVTGGQLGMAYGLKAPATASAKPVGVPTNLLKKPMAMPGMMPKPAPGMLTFGGLY